MSPTIKHPAPVSGTVSAVGLDFVDGVAEVKKISDEARTVLVEHGFAIEDGKAPVTIPEGDPAESWTVDQLKAYAEREKLPLGDAKKKDEFLAAIAKAKADKAAPASSEGSQGGSQE